MSSADKTEVLPYRADHVGSLLRPPALLAARERAKEGQLTATQLRAEEDKAIRDAVHLQEEAGLRGITDGEFRRTYFHIDFLEQLRSQARWADLPVVVVTGQDLATADRDRLARQKSAVVFKDGRLSQELQRTVQTALGSSSKKPGADTTLPHTTGKEHR